MIPRTLNGRFPRQPANALLTPASATGSADSGHSEDQLGCAECADHPNQHGHAQRALSRCVTGSAFRGSRLRGFYDRLVSLEWEQTIVDARDPRGLGRWWQEALGWVVVSDDPDEFEIRPAADRLPGFLFVPVPESKTSKNRLHLDFRPDDRDVEVERLLALGATRADIGQGERSWIVLADPEGNEFCVLRSRSL